MQVYRSNAVFSAIDCSSRSTFRDFLARPPGAGPKRHRRPPYRCCLDWAVDQGAAGRSQSAAGPPDFGWDFL